MAARGIGPPYRRDRLSQAPRDASLTGQGTSLFHLQEKTLMAWTTPKIAEVACGMEINMYASAKKK